MKPEIASAAIDAGSELIHVTAKAAVDAVKELGAMPPQIGCAVDVERTVRLFMLEAVTERCLKEMSPAQAEVAARLFAETLLASVGIETKDDTP